MIDAEFAQQLIPAFISGGLFILIIAVGVVWMVRLQLKGWTREECLLAARGLRTSGIATVVAGALLTAAVSLFTGRYGVWAYAVPVSVVVAGAIFLAAGLRLRRERL
jgi:hypothetical protein